MSLFKSREWWCTQCGSDEQFEKSSFLVSRLNSDYQYVIVGSLNGFLRIYQPITEKQDDGRLLGYQPNDLIIELQLPYPILQICTGRLVSGSQIMQLAILHPKSVGVYSLVTKLGVAEHGNQNNVLLVYEHLLKRTASNLVVGPFGGPLNRDFMCIQSLDGMLTFFEQEIFSFCCFLPDFLLPGPIVFVKSTDSFVTINSNWQIESFSYKRLSENGENSNQTDIEGKKFDADWSYNIGENILDISVVENGSNDNFLVILGERNLYCLACTGKLIFMKKFDFAPQCFHPYFMRLNSKLMILVVAETNTLLVYENSSLRWSAQLSFLPVAINRGFFRNIDGTLVLLSDSGFLQFCYLGTEPQLFTAPPLQNQDLDFDQAEQELSALTKIIKSKQNCDNLLNISTEREIIFNVKVNTHLEPCTFQHEISFETDEEIFLPMCLVSVELTPNISFDEVQVSLIVEQPLKTHPNIHFTNYLEDKIIFDSYVYLLKPLEVASLEIKVIVSLISSTGGPKILSKTAQLPMKLVMNAATPIKEALNKVTLNINEQAPALSVLFPEYVGEESLSLSSSAVAFKNISGAGSPVTILLAKNSERYRLQSNSAASLSLLVEQLILRLQKHFVNKSDFSIQHTSSLPTAQFLETIDYHFSKKQTVITIQNQLSELSAQFRLIQKRLIMKFKDKNPTPVNNLDVLMFETYTEIIECSDKLQIEKDELLKAQCELSCLIRLMMTLLKYCQVPEDIFEHIKSVFITSVCDIEGQGWEEVIEVCISYLLRTIIAKSEKDSIKNACSSLEQVKDINKFKKKISQVIDRVLKSKEGQNVSNLEEKAVVNTQTTEELTQMGSNIAISSVRVQSAKLTRSKLLSTPEESEDTEV